MDIFDEVYNDQVSKIRVKKDQQCIKHIVDKLMISFFAAGEERYEILEALGAENGRSSWKTWKKDHLDAIHRKIEDFTPEQLAQLYREVADNIIYAIQPIVIIGLDPERTKQAIIEKMIENGQRDDNY